MDPRFAAAALNRGIVHFREKRYGEAIVDFEHALRDGANPAAVHYNLALVYREKGDHERALASAKRALESDASHQDAQALADQLRKP
jgi:tetratricopeptide (TPR) repeat protein